MKAQMIENLLPSAGNSVYRLIRMAANRALEISDGKPCLIKSPVSDKATTMALEEIVQGKVESRDVANSRQSQSKKSSK